MPKRHGFSCERAELESLAQAVLERARRAGASGCDCDVSEGYGLSVTVRKGKPDTVEHNRDRSLGVSVYFGDRDVQFRLASLDRGVRDGDAAGSFAIAGRCWLTRTPARAGYLS